MKKRKVVVGSRESKLAIMQTQLVIDEISKNHPELEIELVTMKTTGDIILDKNLDKIGGKGLFVKELDKALMEKRVDITVHSLKDMPMEVSSELPLLAFFKRENPFDTLVLLKGENAENIDLTKPIGSSSARRNIQLEELFPGFIKKPVRGNVITRLEKLDSGEFGSLILAHAGLKRLGLENRITKTFTPEEMIPAAGQGILVVQGRAGEDYSYLECIDDKKSRMEAEAERAFVTRLDGGCSAPIGAYAKILEDDFMEIYGLYADEKTGKYKKGYSKSKVKDGVKMAVELADKLKREVSDDE